MENKDLLYCKNGHLLDMSNDKGSKYKYLSSRCKICIQKRINKYFNSYKGKICLEKYYSLKIKGKRKKRGVNNDLFMGNILKH